MTAPAHALADSTALAPVRSAILAAFGTDRLPGLAPRLLVTDPIGWMPATRLIDGSRLSDLLTAAARNWDAAPHAAAALAWKAYTYWLALPTVLAWASARRVPLAYPDDVLVHTAGHRALVTVGLRRTIRVAVLPNDPLAVTSRLAPAGRGTEAPPADGLRAGAAPGHRPARPARFPGRGDAPVIVVVPDEAALLKALRASMLDAHLTPLLERMRSRVNLGARTLLGSLAANVAHAVIRAADGLPGSTAANAGTLLDALDVADLVDLVPGPGGELTVQRKTCCLAFTLPKPKICSGCCIRPV